MSDNEQTRDDIDTNGALQAVMILRSPIPPKWVDIEILSRKLSEKPHPSLSDYVSGLLHVVLFVVPPPRANNSGMVYPSGSRTR